MHFLLEGPGVGPGPWLVHGHVLNITPDYSLYHSFWWLSCQIVHKSGVCPIASL